MNDLEEWMELEADSSVTTEMIDEAVKVYNDIKEEYTKADRAKKEQHKQMEDQKKKVLDLLQKAGKTKYHVDGLGTVYQSNKYLVQTPKSLEDKQKFFDYLKESFGETFLMDKLSVHSGTLNKIYNDAFTELKENGGDVSTFEIPGLNPPQVFTNLNFRKENK